MSKIIDITKSNFELTISDNAVVFIDFGAPWCAPCKQFARVFEDVANECSDMTFATIDVDSEQEIASNFHIQSIPHLMVFKQGIVIYSESGSMPKSSLLDLVAQASKVDVAPIKHQIEQQGGKA